jgi:hypothetical protein
MTSHTRTPEANRKANAARRTRLTQAAQAAGYSSIDRLAQAILRGEITMSTKLSNLIGKHLNSKTAKAADWLGYWPTVDERGIITGIVDADNVPDGSALIDWSTSGQGGHPVRLTEEQAAHGFEAILDD